MGYIFKRLLLIIPTLIGILLVNFIIIQFSPGGPVERTLAQIEQNQGESSLARFSGNSGDTLYQGSRGVNPDLRAKLEQQYGFDQPITERFLTMVANFIMFDFGTSFYQDRQVWDIIVTKLPVSISLGLWTMIITYLIAIPLGVMKARRPVDGKFNKCSSAILIVSYSIPAFLIALLGIVLFSGGSYWQILPLGGLVSDGFANLNMGEKIIDYLWHMLLPITSMVVGSIASLCFLTRNSFIDELGKHYVRTAYAKGASTKKVLYGHVFRNAMLIVIAAIPAQFLTVIFTGSVLIEVLFSLDGIGLLAYESAMNRDYPIVFTLVYIMTLIALISRLVGDIAYTIIDPRINFSKN